MIDYNQLWQHQRDAVQFALQVDNFGLFHEMGTGKTGTLINILRRRFAEKGVMRKTLILAPLITLENWKQEFAKFSKIDQAFITVLKGTGRQRLAQLKREITDPAVGTLCRNRIIITNFETMQMKDIHSVLKSWTPEILVCDEAHRLRNYKSKRARAVLDLADRARHVYMLTGSPVLNDAQDVFMQYRILDKGKTFGDNFFAFRGKYFVDKNQAWSSKPGHFPDFEIRETAHREIHEKMYKYPDGKRKAHRMLKSECLDLPPLVKQVIKVELSPDQKKMYKEMKDEFITFVATLKDQGTPRAVVANLAITKALRLQQIVTGFAKAEDGNTYEIVGNPRLEALSDLLEDLTPNGKVIVWGCFKQNYLQVAEVCKKLGLEYRELHGDISIAQKNTNMEEFRKDPRVRVMIANQAAAGVGVNLVEAPYSVYYSRNFSLEQDMQSEARNYRGGSEMHGKVTRYDIVASGTIDELVAETLARKQSISDCVLDWKI